MSCKCRNRDVWDAKLRGIEDPAERLSILKKSPHRRHQKKVGELIHLITKVQGIVEGANDVQTEAVG